MCNPILQALGLIFLSQAVAATPAAPLTLFEAAAAATQAPVVGSRESMAEAAALRIGPADELPDPEALLALQNLPIEGADAFEFGRERMSVARVGLMQRVPNAAKRQARRALAERRHDWQDARAEAARAEAARAAALAWIGHWVAGQRLQLLEELRAPWQLLVQAADAAVHGGGAAADAAAARAALAGFENRVIAARAQLYAAEAELARWVGGLARHPLAPPPEFTRLDVAALRARLSTQSGLAPAREAVAVADGEVALASAERRSDWALAASYGARGREFGDVFSLELRVDLPLFKARRQDPLVAARQHELQASEQAFEDALRMRRAALESAIARWQAAALALENQRASVVPLREQAAELALAGYAGAGTPLYEAVAARRDAVAARLDALDAQAELARAWAELAFLHGLPAGPDGIAFAGREVSP